MKNHRIRRIAKRLLGIKPPNQSWQELSQFVELDPTVQIAPNSSLVIIDKPSPSRIMIRIGKGSQIFGNVTLLTSESRVLIGENVQFGASQIISSQSISIGDDTLISWGVTLLDSDTHSQLWPLRSKDVRNAHRSFETDGTVFRFKDWSSVISRPISIGRRCWIGFDSIILKGVEIGDNAIVGAGTVVRHSIPRDQVCIGNPGQIVMRNHDS